MKFDNPCKDCSERHVGCHSDCEKYIKAREIYEKEKERIREIQKKEGDASGFRKANVLKTLRNKGIKA